MKRRGAVVVPGPFQLRRRRGEVVAIVTFFCLAAQGNSADLAFRRHVINAESEYSAVAVLDVNRDGKLDVLCGGFWYEAPDWRRHFVRDVERIGGRFDGYSHLPLDVNGDGWTDVINVNYRSRSIKWVQHPGAKLGPWSVHTVDEPGAMETGRLVDVDGDGRLDVLPNGQQFAAWWELEPGTHHGAPRWTRHELPPEVAGHGVGLGDINGDGRGDVVGPRGWAAAPPDPRKERWVWNREFDLGRASVPVLVVDVDEDGDNDLVWTRAHGFGIYWMEQTRGGEGKRRWVHHTIDTSWSQCHSPLWADMDGDGRCELVAGKRYMAHEGRDPGAYDPLVSYRYQFDARTRTWHRWTISDGEDVGFGLDPKVVDLDEDGDLDLVVCGRSGLYWLENEGPPPVARPAGAPPSYQDHADLMVVKRAASERPVETLFDWGLRRRHIVASLQQALGSLPKPIERVPLDVRIRQQRATDAYTHRAISFQATAGRRVDADLWLPKDIVSGVPGLLYVQRPSPNAPSSGAGDASRIAEAFAGRGYACIVLTLPVQKGTLHAAQPAADGKEVDIGRDVWTCMRAADLLESLPQVRGDRLGCLGKGPGSPLALLVAALDQRLIATRCEGGLTAVGDIGDRFSNGFAVTRPLVCAELIAAIAPRSLSFCAANPDAPELDLLQQAVSRASAPFGLYRVAEPPTIGVSRVTGTPNQTPSDTYEWLDRRLKRAGGPSS